ncbi:MAG: fibrobacter succinogenes major paralogous domain-containing protein [Candidatus Nomurabacteria bacterium]|nr:fibrobacter succinogenes major paralogous domain-containing protein [Candidatus Nomurabacteria bacterium]
MSAILGLCLASANIASAENTQTTLTINATLALSATNCPGLPDVGSGSMTLDVSPVPAGTFRSDCQDVSIATNAPGYNLTVKVLNSDGGNALLYQNPSVMPLPTIPSLAGSATMASPTTISANQWGFAVSSSNVNLTSSPAAGFDATYTVDNASNKYAALPTTDTTVYQTDQLPGQTDVFKFFYGVNVNTSQVAGSYRATVTYTAVAETVPEPIPTTMQDLTADYCANNMTVYDASNPGAIMTLTDARDGKNYQVAKLADGKCWTVDNLQFELTPGMVLNPSTTDISAPKTIYFTVDDSQGGTPLSGLTGNFTTSGFLTRDGTISHYPPNNDGWRQVDTTTTDPTYGYMYNWYTAVAGSVAHSGVNYTADVTAPDSICPAGWRLPAGGGDKTVGTPDDYSNLDAYMAGYAGNQDPAYQSAAPGGVSSFYSNWSPAGPFKGALAGLWEDAPQFAGMAGGYHGSTASSEYSGRAIMFMSGMGVYTGQNSERSTGLAVRCILRQ